MVYATSGSLLDMPVAVSPDGALVAVGLSSGRIPVFASEGGPPLQTFNGDELRDGSEGWAVSVAFSPDGTRLLAGTRGNGAKLWAARPGAAREAEQARAACERLRDANAPLEFTAADVAVFPILRGAELKPCAKVQ